jgi:hypothetical protein
MRFEFQTSFQEQYIATLSVLFRIPLQIVVSAVFPLGGLFLLLFSIATDSLSLANLAVILLCFGFTPLLTALGVWLHRRRNMTSVGPFVYEIDDQNIRVTGGVFELKLAWQGIHKVVETKRFFLFFVSPRMAQFLPKRAVTNAEQLSELRQLVAAKVRNSSGSNRLEPTQASEA